MQILVIIMDTQLRKNKKHSTIAYVFVTIINIQRRKIRRRNTKIHILRHNHKYPKQKLQRTKKKAYIFVTTGNRNVAIIPLSRHDRLNTISNQIPRLQAIAHASRAHWDGIADTNSVEPEPNHAGISHPLLHSLWKLQQMHVAGVALVPNRWYTDLRLVHVLIRETHAIEDGLWAALGLGLGDMRAVLVELVGRLFHRGWRRLGYLGRCSDRHEAHMRGNCGSRGSDGTGGNGAMRRGYQSCLHGGAREWWRLWWRVGIMRFWAAAVVVMDRVYEILGTGTDDERLGSRRGKQCRCSLWFFSVLSHVSSELTRILDDMLHALCIFFINVL